MHKLIDSHSLLILMDIVNIIPRPYKVDVKSGMFSLTPETAILVSEAAYSVGAYLAQRLMPGSGFEFKVTLLEAGNQQKNCIILRLDPEQEEFAEEGYTLSVMPDRIIALAPSPSGIFYACQTLLQLFPPVIENPPALQGITWTIPQVEIEDKPGFNWRGMHLDVCRHFMPKEFIKIYIDLLARYKMNRFHWHLTEDQGWRIEIEQYPKLTGIGAWRDEDNGRYGGYYTQTDILEIIEYAKQRFVTIVPEIEMPGHAVAALTAHPELSCTGGPFQVETTWGIFKDVFCAGNDQTFEFLERVLAEVIAMFPGQYIHIGGDECPKNRWKKCPKCQARMRAENLKNENELQSYFIRRIEQFLLSCNRHLIGWDEILEGGLAPQAAVMSWRSMKGGIQAAQLGHDVVMCPESYCYFDHYQSLNLLKEPMAISGYTPLKKVYSFEPVPSALNEEQAQHILGVQGNLWTEYIHTPEHAEYMLLPRMCALAEVVWSDKKLRNLDDFRARLTSHYARFDALGVNYRRSED